MSPRPSSLACAKTRSTAGASSSTTHADDQGATVFSGGGGGGGKERARPERYTLNDVDSDSEQPVHRGACSDDHSLAISMQEAESAGVGCFRHEPPPGDAELAQYLAHKEDSDAAVETTRKEKLCEEQRRKAVAEAVQLARNRCRSTEQVPRCSSQAKPVVKISQHQIKMSKKRKNQDHRAGVRARQRVAKAKGATQSPPPSPPPSPPFAASSSGSSLPLLLKAHRRPRRSQARRHRRRSRSPERRSRAPSPVWSRHRSPA